MFVSKNYLEEVKKKDREITEQISMVKEYDKPTFLIYKDLSTEEIKEADELFKEHKCALMVIRDTFPTVSR